MQDNAMTVSSLTKLIKDKLETDFNTVIVQGELSNFIHHSSGHKYFSLKDSNAQISCVMWRSKPLTTALSNGMKVIVTGNLTVYPPRGNYQIDCTSVFPVGVGDLYLEFEKLKKELEELGYFDSNFKKRIPILPTKIGVITSPTGAAVKDIFSTIERRFPQAEIYFRPGIVQGDKSAEDLAKAIEQLDKLNLDLIIFGRGGGSIEDLWSFNSREVADAIFKCKTPIISGVGHETDFTISDFVADIRAATPTAAAELASPLTVHDFIEELNDIDLFLKKLILRRIDSYDMQLENIESSNLVKKLYDKINNFDQQIDTAELMFSRAVKSIFNKYSEKLKYYSSHLYSLSPLKPLEKGFALLYQDGKIIRNDTSLSKFKRVEIKREHESALAKIEKIFSKQLFD